MTEFRVYRCPSCGNVGSDRITDRDVDSLCSLCDTVISDLPGMVYVSSADEVHRKAVMLVSMARTEIPKTSMGLGLRKRILDMVIGLEEMNRGWPVPLEQIITECTDAGIPRDRAIHFLDKLRTEELITLNDGSVSTVT